MPTILSSEGTMISLVSLASSNFPMKRSILDDLQDPQIYIELVYRTELCRYFSLLSLVIVVWDWALKLDSEIAHIWRPRRTGMSGAPLYCYLRYCGFAYQAYDVVVNFGMWSADFCKVYFYTAAFSSVALLYAVDVLLAYRALCLYRMSRKMVIFNLVFFILCILSTAVIIAIAFKTGLKAIPTPEYLTGCWSLLGGLISLMAVPGLIFELWLFGMVVFKVVQFSHELGRGSRYNLVRILLMDSMSWFVIVASMIIVNGVAYGVLPIGLRIIALPTLRSVCIICGCHLILHMRQARAEEETIVSPEQGPGHDSGFSSKGIPAPPRPSLATIRPSPSPVQDTGRQRMIHFLQRRDPSSPRHLPRETRNRPSRQLHAILERTKIRRAVDFAQNFGMPPPLTRDLDGRSLWDDPVMTLNHGMETQMERTLVLDEESLPRLARTAVELDASSPEWEKDKEGCPSTSTSSPSPSPPWSQGFDHRSIEDSVASTSRRSPIPPARLIITDRSSSPLNELGSRMEFGERSPTGCTPDSPIPYIDRERWDSLHLAGSRTRSPLPSRR